MFNHSKKILKYLILIILLSSDAFAQDSKTIHFLFNPKDGTTFVQKAIGDSWKKVEPLTFLDGSEIECESKIHVEVVEPCAQGQCARIRQSYDIDDMDTAFINKTIKDVVESFQSTKKEPLPVPYTKNASVSVPLLNHERKKSL